MLGGALIAEGVGELSAQPLVVLAELTVACLRGLEPAQQGGVGGALSGRDGRCWGSSGDLAEPFDVGAQVRLGVEPGTGDTGVVGDRFEGDGGAGAVELTQRADRLGPGELVAVAGGRDQRGGVV